jgi:(p)ppGpp synthase/HD superfamily hydrolase
MVTADTLERAILFAVKAHKGQRRKGDGRPYIMHPVSVMNLLYNTKESRNLFLLASAAVLHDTVEDCGVSLKKIAKKFGYHVAALVGELTLDKEQYAVIGKKEYLLTEMCKMSSYALCIKLCDRIDNVRDLRRMDKEFKERYLYETKYLLNGLMHRDLTDTHMELYKVLTKEYEHQFNNL